MVIPQLSGKQQLLSAFAFFALLTTLLWGFFGFLCTSPQRSPNMTTDGLIGAYSINPSSTS